MRAVQDTGRVVVDVTIWHLFSAICFFAAVIAANDVATSQNVSISAHGVFLLVGICLGIVISVVNFLLARHLPPSVLGADRSIRITGVLIMVLISVGLIVLADWSGGWTAARALRLLGP